MEELQYFERIEAYMDDRMSIIERQQFEIELEDNPLLKEEYDAFIATTVALEWMVQEDLSKEIDNSTKNKFTVIKNKKRWLAFAASIMLLLFLGIGSFAKLNYSNEILVQQFYKNPNWTSIIRGDENKVSQSELNQLLGNENYIKVISYLENIPVRSTNYDYLLANAYLKNNQVDKAIVAFQNVISSTDNDAKDGAEWYLALSYLQNGDIENSKLQVKRIIKKNNHPNKQNALQLDTKLNSSWRKMLFWKK